MRAVRLLSLSLLALAMPVMAGELPNYDMLSLASPRPPESALVRQVSTLTNGAFRVQWDTRLGVPTFLWAPPTTLSVASAKRGSEETAEVAARRHLETYAPVYGLSASDVSDAYVSGLHDTGKGAVVVKLRQKIGGVEIFREEVNIIMTRDRDLMAISGYLTSPGSVLRTFALSPALAVGLAYADMFGTSAPRVSRIRATDGGYDLYAAGDLPSIRVKRVYFHLPDQFEPAYSLELAGTTAAYSYL